MKFLALVFLSVVSLTMGQDSCPDPADIDKRLRPEDNTTSVLAAYRRVRRNQMRNVKTDGNYINDLESSDRKCPMPTFPDDDPNVKAASKPQVAEVSQAVDFVQVVKRTCEPCPYRQHFLGRFFRRCYVIAPTQQQVRYVTCRTKRCFAPCMCSRSYCQRTHWIRVWFFSFCVGNGPFPGGFQSGINFRYLWLPQDCTCVNV